MDGPDLFCGWVRLRYWPSPVDDEVCQDLRLDSCSGLEADVVAGEFPDLFCGWVRLCYWPSPVDDEVCQDLRLDSCPGLEADVVAGEFVCPLGNPH